MLTSNDEKKIKDMIIKGMTEVLHKLIIPVLDELASKKDLEEVKERLEQIDRKVDHFVDKVQIHETKLNEHDKRLKKLELN